MNVTSKGRYALRIMVDLARRNDEGYVSLKTIADRTDSSMKYMEAIVGSLKKAELIDSTRGKEGGYKLARKPEEYSVEDNLAPVSCIKAGSVECDRAGECITVPMWMELDEIINAYLDGITLQDLLTGDKWRKDKK